MIQGLRLSNRISLNGYATCVFDESIFFRWRAEKLREDNAHSPIANILQDFVFRANLQKSESLVP